MREVSWTRKAGDMVRMSIQLLALGMALSNKMRDIVLVRKWGVIPSLLQRQTENKIGLHERT